MEEKKSKLAWDLFTELRKETLESQRMRTQVIGFKITFVSAGIGFIYANKAPGELIVIPAFAAIFFDLLIISYSISIRRIGLYCREYLEKKLEEEVGMGNAFCYWEQFFERNQIRPFLPIFANLGITLLALIAATLELNKSSIPYIGWLQLPLVALFCYDVAAFFIPERITNNKKASKLMRLFFKRHRPNNSFNRSAS
jgi:hypothetical protein